MQRRPTLLSVKEAVKALQGLRNAARLELVDRAEMPAFRKAKVLIPGLVKPELALQLLQRQNMKAPISDWRVLHVSKLVSNNAG